MWITTVNVIGVLNCPITNCPITTWEVIRWKIGVYLKNHNRRKWNFYDYYRSMLHEELLIANSKSLIILVVSISEWNNSEKCVRVPCEWHSSGVHSKDGLHRTEVFTQWRHLGNKGRRRAADNRERYMVQPPGMSLVLHREKSHSSDGGSWKFHPNCFKFVERPFA